MTAPKPSLAATTFKGVLWLLFQSAGARIVGLLTQLALAKVLLPSQFGVIGLVYTLTGISAAVVNFGVDGVMLQRHRTHRLWVLPAFLVSLGLGAAGFLVVALLAPVFAHVYHSPQIIPLALVLALGMPLGALTTIPAVRLRSDLNFRFPAVYGTAENVVSQVATVALAVLGFGAMSFVLPAPVLAVVRALAYWWRAPVAVAGRLRLMQLRYLLGNGLSVFGARLIGEVTAQADYAILGLMAPHSQVGFYYFAFRLSAQPLWVLAGNFCAVLFPALVQLKSDPARQLRAALNSANMLCYLIMPACLLQAAVAGPALRAFFGHKWEGSIHLAQLLSLGIPFDATAWVAGALLTARRQFHRGLISGLISLPCFIAMATIGASAAGATGTAALVALYYVGFGPLYSYFNLRHCGARLSDVINLYAKPLILSALAMSCAWLASRLPAFASSNLLQVFSILTVGPVFYGLLLWVFERAVLLSIMARFGVERISRLWSRSKRPAPSG